MPLNVCKYEQWTTKKAVTVMTTNIETIIALRHNGNGYLQPSVPVFNSNSIENNLNSNSCNTCFISQEQFPTEATNVLGNVEIQIKVQIMCEDPK